MKRESAVNISITVLLVVVPVIACIVDETYYVNLASRVAVIAMAAVGLNFALGYGGMISFGHAAVFGIGGYVAGISAFHAFNSSFFAGILPGTTSMPLIWLVTLLVAALVSTLIGIVALRTRGVYFIMITLAFAQMFYYFGISFPLYGGEDGLPIYIRNTFPLLNTSSPLVFFTICFLCLMGSLALTSLCMNSRFGAALTVVKLNEGRLAASGIEPFPIKLTAFVISGMITAMAGALFADLNGFVGPSMLSWHRSGELMIITILGGVGRLFGPVVGAVIFVLLEVIIGGLTERWQFFVGLILLTIVLFGEGGAIGLLAGKKKHA